MTLDGEGNANEFRTEHQGCLDGAAPMNNSRVPTNKSRAQMNSLRVCLNSFQKLSAMPHTILRLDPPRSHRVGGQRDVASSPCCQRCVSSVSS
jgi:hypothetical protein